MTKQELTAELQDVRYYNTHREMFRKAENTGFKAQTFGDDREIRQPYHQRSHAAANGVSQDIYGRQNASGCGKGIGYLRQLHEKPYAEVIRISAGTDKQVRIWHTGNVKFTMTAAIT